MSSTLKRIARLAGAFRRDHKGAVGIVFAFAIVPALMTIGLAVDYSGGMEVRTKLQAATDSAALGAVRAVQLLDEKYGSPDAALNARAQTEAEEQAKEMFVRALQDETNVHAAKMTINFVKDPAKGTYTVVAQYTGQYKTAMPNPVGITMLDLAGKSESTLAVSGQGFMEISTLLDTSRSMGLGANPSDIQVLTSQTGCAFKCHHGDATHGAVLRIDVLRSAVGQMITEAQASVGLDQIKRIKIGINSFRGTAVANQPMSNDYTLLASKVPEIRLPLNSDSHHGPHGVTNIGGALDWLTPTITVSGDGKTLESPKKFVFLVTDGMENRAHEYRAQNYLGPTSYYGNTGSLDPARCADLKAKGVTVAVLYTTYLENIGASWAHYAYLSALPGIKPNLESCASPGFFFEAATGNQLQAEFKKMFKKATSVAGVRLAK